MAGLDLVTPPATAVERQQLAEAAERLGEADGVAALRVGPAGPDIPVSGEVTRALQALLALLGQGVEVWLVPRQREVTPQQAAGILGVSRQYLTRVMDAGYLPFRRVGSHRRIAVADLLAYQRERVARREALKEITRLSDELGLYDGEG